MSLRVESSSVYENMLAESARSIFRLFQSVVKTKRIGQDENITTFILCKSHSIEYEIPPAVFETKQIF